MIILQPIHHKQLETFIKEMLSISNSKYPSLHTPYTVGLLSLSRSLLILDQFSSFHHKSLYCNASGSSFYLVSVAVSCYAELSAPDSMGINYQKPTTNFPRASTLIFFLHPLILYLSWCSLMNFRFISLFFFK